MSLLRDASRLPVSCVELVWSCLCSFLVGSVICSIGTDSCGCWGIKQDEGKDVVCYNTHTHVHTHAHTCAHMRTSEQLSYIRCSADARCTDVHKGEV